MGNLFLKDFTVKKFECEVRFLLPRVQINENSLIMKLHALKELETQFEQNLQNLHFCQALFTLFI